MLAVKGEPAEMPQPGIKVEVKREAEDGVPATPAPVKREAEPEAPLKQEKRVAAAGAHRTWRAESPEPELSELSGKEEHPPPKRSKAKPKPKKTETELLEELRWKGLTSFGNGKAVFDVTGSKGTPHTVTFWQREVWETLSQSARGKKPVGDGFSRCTCQDYCCQQRTCKHIRLILQNLEIQHNPHTWYEVLAPIAETMVQAAAAEAAEQPQAASAADGQPEAGAEAGAEAQAQPAANKPAAKGKGKGKGKGVTKAKGKGKAKGKAGGKKAGGEQAEA